MCEAAPTPQCVCVHLRERRLARWGGVLSVSVLCVRKAESDTLVCSLLAPLWGRSTQASPGDSGCPLGTGQDREGEEGQHGGQAFSHYEKEWNQIQAKSPSIYCIPHLSKAPDWKEIRGGNCTMGLGRTSEERKAEKSRVEERRGEERRTTAMVLFTVTCNKVRWISASSSSSEHKEW